MNPLREISERFAREISLYRRVLKDPRTPRRSRWLLAATVAYALSPIDIIPDFIPVLGSLDDAVILPVLVWLALRAIPREVVAEHRSALAREREVAQV